MTRKSLIILDSLITLIRGSEPDRVAGAGDGYLTSTDVSIEIEHLAHGRCVCVAALTDKGCSVLAGLRKIIECH